MARLEAPKKNLAGSWNNRSVGRPTAAVSGQPPLKAGLQPGQHLLEGPIRQPPTPGEAGRRSLQPEVGFSPDQAILGPQQRFHAKHNPISPGPQPLDAALAGADLQGALVPAGLQVEGWGQAPAQQGVGPGAIGECPGGAPFTTFSGQHGQHWAIDQGEILRQNRLGGPGLIQTQRRMASAIKAVVGPGGIQGGVGGKFRGTAGRATSPVPLSL